MTRRRSWLLAVAGAAALIAPAWPRGAIATVVFCCALAYAGAWRAALAASLAMALLTLRLAPPVQPQHHPAPSAAEARYDARDR